MPATLSVSASRSTGTTSPSGAATAMPILMRFFRIMASSAQDELSSGFSRSDSATVFITKCRYVRLTPSRRWKSSFSASRRRTSPLTSTSVIDHAAGISDALRFIFAAIIRRTGDRGRRSSSAVTDTAETVGTEVAGASRTVDCARASVYASTSLRVIRPLIPVPCTCERSMPCSSASRCTAGE